jgi:hypothetical protein
MRMDMLAHQLKQMDVNWNRVTEIVSYGTRGFRELNSKRVERKLNCNVQ